MVVTDRVVLVTGGARRIGATIARELHAGGYSVAVHYRSSGEDAAALAAELSSERPGSAFTLCGDIAQVSECRRLVEEVIGRFGRLDLLVNNASSFYPTPLSEATEGQWDELTGSNLKGPFFLSQAAAPHLAEVGGSIVNLVDVHAFRVLADHAIYTAAKAGLVSLTRSLAHDLAPTVRVNGIAPGAILWPEDGSTEAAQRATLAAIPLDRQGETGDIARTVSFLAASPYITGEVIHVDGGRSLT